MVRAIASETKSLVMDLSPAVIAEKYTENKNAWEKMVAMVFKAAKQYAPSVVYIDECEKVFPAKKKKGKGKKGGGGKKSDAGNPSRIKKALVKWKGKWIDDATRITVIGCTSEPQEGNIKEFKKMFDRSIYFPYPDYTTCCRMWKVFIEQYGGVLTTDFPLNTLAHMSSGYSAGSIRKTAEFVLTPFRREKLSSRPLKLAEFIGPLSQCAVTDKETMEEVIKPMIDKPLPFTNDAKRRKDIEAALRGDDEGGDAKKKKKKGK